MPLLDRRRDRWFVSAKWVKRLREKESTSDIDNDIAEVLFRIAYTGSDDFSISIDINYGDLPTTGLREDARLGTMRLNLRYYF